MRRVYIAGAYSSDNILGVLNNIRIGLRSSTEVLLCNFAPFCPWLDFHYILMSRPEENEKLTIEHFYNYTLAWLEVAHCILVLPGFENSKGTLKEIEKAKELQIPIYYSLEELIKREK